MHYVLVSALTAVVFVFIGAIVIFLTVVLVCDVAISIFPLGSIIPFPGPLLHNYLAFSIAFLSPRVLFSICLLE